MDAYVCLSALDASGQVFRLHGSVPLTFLSRLDRDSRLFAVVGGPDLQAWLRSSALPDSQPWVVLKMG